MSERFATTKWSLVLAGRGRDDAARRALDSLLTDYRPPLLAFARRLGGSPQDAEDLVQSFLLELVQRDLLHRADPAKGKLRAFLLTAFRRHIQDAWTRKYAAKRGGGQTHQSLDELRDLAQAPDSAAHFDRDWARRVLDLAWRGLRDRYDAEAKGEVFEVLHPWLDRETETGDIATLAGRLRLSENAAKVALHRLRKRFAEALRSEIAETLTPEDSIDEELRHLLRAAGQEPLSS